MAGCDQSVLGAPSLEACWHRPGRTRPLHVPWARGNTAPPAFKLAAKARTRLLVTPAASLHTCHEIPSFMARQHIQKQNSQKTHPHTCSGADASAGIPSSESTVDRKAGPASWSEKPSTPPASSATGSACTDGRRGRDSGQHLGEKLSQRTPSPVAPGRRPSLP